MPIHLVTSPGDDYANAMLAALADAKSFVLVTGFASVSGVQVLERAIGDVLRGGGQGRVVLAVDRQGFNTSAVFEALLALKASQGARLSIGIVLQESGLLHAKALFTRGPRGDQLLVGSANLTRSALGTNHELGLLLSDTPPDLRTKFLEFVTGLAPRSLDADDAREFLVARGLLSQAQRSAAPPVLPPRPDLAVALSRLKPLEPLLVPPEEHLAGWIRRGYLVGQGRRSIEALVLRVPQDQLVKLGWIRPTQRETLGIASHETRRLGYGVDLLPRAEAEILRRDARRVSLVLSKLTLTLPCFGSWMPENYWESFLLAREALGGAATLERERVRELAAHHREDLSSGGLEREVDHILARLEKLEMLVPGRGPAIREYVLPRLRAELELRTPEMLAGCVEFRTARQQWSPSEQTDAPYRSLMVDVVESVFASTRKTGDWPRQFRSFAARHLATGIEQRFAQLGIEVNAEIAGALLDDAATWELPTRPMAEVVQAFRRLVDDDVTFPVPTLATLTSAAEEESTDKRAPGENDDDIR